MSNYAERVLRIRCRFLETFEQRLDGIEQARAEVAGGQAEAMDTLHLRLHDLCGNAAMLGLDAIAREARRGLESIERADSADADEISQMLGEVRQSTLLIRELQNDIERSE